MRVYIQSIIYLRCALVFKTHLKGLGRVLVFAILDIILNWRSRHGSLERHWDQLRVKLYGGLVKAQTLLLQLVKGVLLSYHDFVLPPDLIVIPGTNRKYLRPQRHIGMLHLT